MVIIEPEKVNNIANVQSEIDTLKNLLHLKAKQYNFDLQHPEIQEFSKRLDELVNMAMRYTVENL